MMMIRMTLDKKKKRGQNRRNVRVRGTSKVSTTGGSLSVKRQPLGIGFSSITYNPWIILWFITGPAGGHSVPTVKQRLHEDGNPQDRMVSKTAAVTPTTTPMAADNAWQVQRNVMVEDADEEDHPYYRGDDHCPCLDLEELPVPVRCKKVDDDDPIHRNITTTTTSTTTTTATTTTTSTIACYPKDFGLRYCKPYNLYLDDACVNPTIKKNDKKKDGTTQHAIPQYCYDPWCYVNYEECLLSEHPIYQSTIQGMSNYYWSYSTCRHNNKDSSSWVPNSLESREEMLVALHHSGMVTLAIPEIYYPRHYKYKQATNDQQIADYDGEEYYNDTIPWHGWMIDYLKDIEQRIKDNDDNVDATAAYERQRQQQPFQGFYFTHRSKGADTLASYSSSWNAALEDVAGGVRDMAGSTFWMTVDRLQRTSFSTPVAVDKMYLFVPSPTTANSLSSNFVKLLKPFTNELWYCLVGSVIVTALLSIFFSNEYGSHRQWWRQFHDDIWETATLLEKLIIALKALLDSILAHSSFLFGHAVDYDIYSNYPKKILTFGYAFLVLIAVAAYTANLAAYLTRSHVGDYIRDINQAIQQEITICAPWSIQNDLMASWPNANFLFPNDASGGSILAMLELYGQGNCTAIVAGTTLDDYLDVWCTHDLFNTGSIVIEMPFGIPTSSTIVGGISHYILDAKKDGTQLSDYFDSIDITDPEICSSSNISSSSSLVDLVEEHSSTTRVNTKEGEEELGQLTPQHFILPFTILIGSAILAIIVHCCNWYSHHWIAIREEEEKRDESGNDIMSEHVVIEDIAGPAMEKSLENVGGLGVGADHHGKDEQGLSTTSPAGQVSSGHAPSTLGTQLTEQVSTSTAWPAFRRASTRPMRRRGPSSGGTGRRRASHGTTTSGRPSISIFELTTILQDSESANDPNIKMEAMECLSKYQNQIWASLHEKDKDE